MWHSNDLGWGWWLVMSIGMVAFWAVVILGAVWLLRGFEPRRDPAATREERPEPPRAVLKRRLAAGEITAEEYEELRRVIDDGMPVAARSRDG